MEETSRIITEAMEYIIPTQRYNEWPSNEYTVPASAMWHVPICDHKIRGVLVVKASDICANGSSKLVERQIEMPFVPVAGTLVRVEDEWAIDSGAGDGSLIIQSCSWLLRVTEMLWDASAESFRARCEVVDGGKYETWEDAKNPWSEV